MNLGRAFGTAGLAMASLSAQAQTRDAVAPPAATASLSGIVITADDFASPPGAPAPRLTGAPVRSATVTLTEVTEAVPTRSTDTDQDGRFAFESLPAGRYDVSATKPAYLKASFGAVRPMRMGSPIAMVAGQQVTAVTLKMWRGGVITGLLLNEKNRPMSNVTVQARRLQLVNGLRTPAAATTGSATTDNRGLYRIFGLPPGDYVVLSSLAEPNRTGPNQPAAARQITADDVQRALRGVPRSGNSSAEALPAEPILGYAPVYYPGTTVAVDAALVHVEAGEERSGIDFAAQLVPLAEVSGTITPPPDRTIAGLQISIALTARSQPASLVVSRPISIGADGRFTISAVAPGQYSLEARASQPPSASNDLSGAVGWWASTPITIDGRHVSGLSLSLERGVSVTGRVVFEGASPPPAGGIGVSVRLTPVGEVQSPDNVRITSTTPEGTFAIIGVAPGNYSLSTALVARSAPIKGWTFKSASAAGRDFTDMPLTVAPGKAVESIVVSFSDRSTEINGVFRDASGRPSSEYFIVALPTNRDLWSAASNRTRLARPGTDGHYLITGLPAGDYFVAATTDAAPDDLSDASFLSRLAESAITITLAEGQTKTQDLRIRRLPGSLLLHPHANGHGEHAILDPVTSLGDVRKPKPIANITAPPPIGDANAEDPGEVRALHFVTSIHGPAVGLNFGPRFEAQLRAGKHMEACGAGGRGTEIQQHRHVYIGQPGFRLLAAVFVHKGALKALLAEEPFHSQTEGVIDGRDHIQPRHSAEQALHGVVRLVAGPCKLDRRDVHTSLNAD